MLEPEPERKQPSEKNKIRLLLVYERALVGPFGTPHDQFGQTSHGPHFQHFREQIPILSK
jgi:hypothetical protein